MSAGFEPEHLVALREHYGGRMSEREAQFLRSVQSFIDDAIRDGLGFADVLRALREDIGLVLMDRYHLDALTPHLAVLKRGQLRKTASPPKRSETPLSEKEIAFLRDIQGFLDYAMRNDLSLRLAIGTVSHDVNGIAKQYDFDLNAAYEETFCPKVAGFAGSHADSVGANEESDD